jgi:hypothetical protein
VTHWPRRGGRGRLHVLAHGEDVGAVDGGHLAQHVDHDPEVSTGHGGLLGSCMVAFRGSLNCFGGSSISGRFGRDRGPITPRGSGRAARSPPPCSRRRRARPHHGRRQGRSRRLDRGRRTPASPDGGGNAAGRKRRGSARSWGRLARSAERSRRGGDAREARRRGGRPPRG